MGVGSMWPGNATKLLILINKLSNFLPILQADCTKYDATMLQNRVDPQGNIIRTSARGAWTGTRGLLHDDKKNIVRSFKHKAWITCLLQFKGRQRVVMSPGLYTELFFLDEATAFAAGHRPCAECRRGDFMRFKMLWLQANPQYGFTMKTSINEIDTIVHAERIDGKGNKVMYKERIGKLADGVFVLLDGSPYLLWAGALHKWTPFGYEENIGLDGIDPVDVLTPKSIAGVLKEYGAQVNLTGLK